jgi:hypothetical protein
VSFALLAQHSPRTCLSSFQQDADLFRFSHVFSIRARHSRTWLAVCVHSATVDFGPQASNACDEQHTQTTSLGIFGEGRTASAGSEQPSEDCSHTSSS